MQALMQVASLRAHLVLQRLGLLSGVEPRDGGWLGHGGHIAQAVARIGTRLGGFSDRPVHPQPPDASIRELGLARAVAEAAQAIPDARDRLRYVAHMTEQAAI